MQWSGIAVALISVLASATALITDNRAGQRRVARGSADDSPGLTVVLSSRAAGVPNLES